ncbi:MAG: preprotein translocase subunit YajC [Streptosporangiales bacterium]|nr:preprotein translocase subunit YajC [Streptosporangiales bacterium]
MRTAERGRTPFHPPGDAPRVLVPAAAVRGRTRKEGCPVQGNDVLAALPAALDSVAAPLAQPSGGGGSALIQFLPLIAIVALFYFMMIRPQRRRQQKMAEMQRNLMPGNEVMTNTGMFATVIDIDDDGVTLEISPGVNVRMLKQSIGQVVNQPEAAQEPEAPVDGSADGANNK